MPFLRTTELEAARRAGMRSRVLTEAERKDRSERMKRRWQNDRERMTAVNRASLELIHSRRTLPVMTVEQHKYYAKLRYRCGQSREEALKNVFAFSSATGGASNQTRNGRASADAEQIWVRRYMFTR